MKKFLNSFKTRSFRVGGYSVFATLIVVALVVLVNVIVNILPSTYTAIDTSANKMYSFSDQTKEIATGVSDPVTFYWVVQDGKEDDSVHNLINRYTGLNSKFKMKKVDPDENPTFLTSYGIDALTNNSVIIESEVRFRYVPYSDIYVTKRVFNNNTGAYDPETSFDGENALTAALHYVVNPVNPVVYMLTGHGEPDLNETFRKALSIQNMDVKNLSFLQETAVPEDCTVLLINAPETDLSEAETALIMDYLMQGGKMMLVTNPEKAGVSHPNLSQIMLNYNIVEKQGILFETDAEYYQANLNQPYGILPVLKDHDVTRPLIDKNYMVLMPYASGLVMPEEKQLNMGEKVTPLLQTSKSSYLKVDGFQLSTYFKEADDLDGPFVTGCLVEQGNTKIFWYTSNWLLDEYINSLVSGGNEDLFVNSMAYMTGQEDAISIHAKSMSYELLSINSKQATTWSIILVGVIPVLILVAGVVIFIRRRVK